MFTRIGTTGDNVGKSVGGKDNVGACDAVGETVGDRTGEDVGSSIITVGSIVVIMGANVMGEALGTGPVGHSVGGVVVGLLVGNCITGHGNSCMGPNMENGLQGSRS